MKSLPIYNGRPCVFRVVCVSGTIRKVEAEAIRRAKLLVLAAKEEMSGKSSSSSDALSALLRSDARQTRSVAVSGAYDDSGAEDDDASDG